MNKTYEKYAFSGKSINCYGLEVIAKSIKKHGYDTGPLNYDSNNDILFSLYWPEQIYDFIKWRYDSRLKNRTVIVGGNTATANPSIINAIHKTKVFLGDGELWDGSIDSEYMADKKEPKEKAVSNKITPFLYEDIQDNRRAFVEMSRGCKNKCLFCQYGWLKKYRESDILDILEIIKRTKTKSVRMFAADRFQHSRYKDIRNVLNRIGKCDTGSDVSLKFVNKNIEYLKLTNKVRVGIEGMSERLRCLIGKKYSDQDIVDFCLNVAKAGIKCFDWYMIYGLPTESSDDVDAFKSLLIKLDECMPKGYTIAIHWNAFTPSAQTPFQWEAGAYNYDTSYMASQLFADHYNKNIKLMHKPKLTSKSTLLKRMLAIRADEKCFPLLYTLSQKQSAFKNNKNEIIKKYKELTGNNVCEEWEENKIFPWDKYVVYKKETMLKLRNKNMKKYN